MKKEIVELKLKMDEILNYQKLILAKLSIDEFQIKKPINEIKKPTKKELERIRQQEIRLVIENRLIIKDQFNLAACPQSHRILSYLESKNPRVFDGLKRKQ